MKLNVGDTVSLKFKSINAYGYYMFGVTGDSKFMVTHIDRDPYIPGRMYICLEDGKGAEISVTEPAIHKVLSKAKKPRETENA